MVEVSPTQWKAIKRLAAELAQRKVDDNLVQTAAAYLKAYPEADLLDWLYRLNRLGEIFSSSNQTGRYRHELWAACERLQPQPRSGAEWGLILAWAARLQKHYETNLHQARRVSDVSAITLPPLPEVYRAPVTIRQAEPDLPSAPDKASKKAEDLFSRLQNLWGSKDED
jgi:hypothetical protein